jgi:hypothetical protein
MSLSDFGVLGIFAILMIGVIVFLGKHFIGLTKRNEDRIKELETALNNYLAEDRKAILETLSDCKNALQNSNKLTEKVIAMLEK